MYRPLVGLCMLVVVGACQSLPESGSPQADRLTRAELDELHELSVRQAIQKLRPDWFRVRSRASWGGGVTTPRAAVFLDGMPKGDLGALDRMDIREIEEIRFISPSDARAQYGTGYPGGIIAVSTGKTLSSSGH